VTFVANQLASYAIRPAVRFRCHRAPAETLQEYTAFTASTRRQHERSRWRTPALLAAERGRESSDQGSARDVFFIDRSLTTFRFEWIDRHGNHLTLPSRSNGRSSATCR